MKVMVAMSGGVDSTVAAGLMVRAGHEVFGLTMKLRDTSPEEQSQGGSCCSPDDLLDAKLACHILNIPHYVVDYRDLFKEKVIDPFAESYLKGKTPNPCVNCNDHVKFAPLLERAKALGADLLVTGHYARIIEEDGEPVLYRAVDKNKDQSYFLFGISQEALKMTAFPLGGMTKDQVREIGKAMGLNNWNKADSEDICFVPSGDYAKVVEEVVGEDKIPLPGPIVDVKGRVLGQHEGLHHYTIGQRRGVKIATGERVYVVDIKPETRTLVVGTPEQLQVVGLKAENCRWSANSMPTQMKAVSAQIRYRHHGAMGNLIAKGEHAEFYFDSPQPAVTPGQAVVFYEGEKVVGGGWISESIREHQIQSPFSAL
jgi:tRNA-specific 2-thiouridylase